MKKLLLLTLLLSTSFFVSASDTHQHSTDTTSLSRLQPPAASNGLPLASCSISAGQTWNVNGFDVRSLTDTWTCTSVSMVP
jgi:hypothetical protein